MIRLFAFVLFSLPYQLLAQQRKAFSISGHSTFYNGQRLFIQGGVLSTFNYNDFNFVQETVDTVYKSFSTVLVQHNQFTINGFQKYPHPFQVSIYDATTESGTSSQFFFADAGAVNIEINDLFTNKYLGNQRLSKSNKEYQHLKKLYSNTVDTLNGKVHDFKAKQKITQKYITQHPNSYVALWDLVIDYAIYKNWKNDDDIKMILKNALLLSSTIKKTTTYKTLLENIKKDLELSSGKTFPNIRLNSTDSLIPIVKKNKFTLVDFWFSGCVPCVRQFPSYKVSYDLNKSKGFEIIGISIDGKKEEADWHKIIQTMKLNWLQYLATNNLTRKLHISGFPTNYLLDNEGKIIKVNIEPEELERFLQQNLH